MALSPALARSQAEHLASLVLAHTKAKEAEYEQTERYNRQPARRMSPQEAIATVLGGHAGRPGSSPSSSSSTHHDEVPGGLRNIDSLTKELLIKELGRSGSAELALALLDELVSQAHAKSSAAAAAVAGPSGRGEQQQSSSHVIKGCYDAALSVCCTQLFGAAAAREALRVYDMMPPADKDVGSCNLVIAACSHGGNVPGVILVIDDMAARGITPNDFTARSALQACMFKRKGGMHEEAIQIVRRLSSMSAASPSPSPALNSKQQQQGGRPSDEIVDALLHVCEAAMDKAASMEAAEGAFEALGGLPGDMQRCPRAYNAILRACARWGKWQAARRYFDEMKQYNLAANTESHNSLIKACLKGGALPHALEVFEQMVAGRGVADPSIHANVETYNSLIKTCHQAGMFEKALEIASWAGLSGTKFNDTTYEGLLGAADVAEMWDKKAIQHATATSLAVFPQHLRPAHFDAMRLAYLDHLGDLQEEEGIAVAKLREKSWAPATLTKGNPSPTPTSPSFGGGGGAGVFSSPRTNSGARLPGLPGFSRSVSPFPPAFSPSPSPSPIGFRVGPGTSSPLVLSRVPSINITIETAVDKFAEQVAVTPEFGNSPRKATDPPLPSPQQHPLSSTPSSAVPSGGTVFVGGAPSPHPAAAPPSARGSSAFGGGGGNGVEMDPSTSTLLRESLRKHALPGSGSNGGPAPSGGSGSALHLPPLVGSPSTSTIERGAGGRGSPTPAGGGGLEAAFRGPSQHATSPLLPPHSPSPKSPLQGRNTPSPLMT